MTWTPRRLTREQLGERRHKGFELLKRKRSSQKDIAKRLGVSEAAVSQWHKVLIEEGIKGRKHK